MVVVFQLPYDSQTFLHCVLADFLDFIGTWIAIYLRVPVGPVAGTVLGHYVDGGGG